MPYTVNKTDSNATPNRHIVQDSVLNTETDISFIGKGYAGYGEVIAENLLHLLENFSNTTQPTKPIKGQLWYDSSTQKLKVFTGSTFQLAGGATYQSSAPAGALPGDLWINSSSKQLYFNDGNRDVLVGPPTSTSSGFTFDTILASDDSSKNITKLYNNDILIGIISDADFSPKISLANKGFATIKKGVQLSTTLGATAKFHGTATNADNLGTEPASTFFKTTGGTVTGKIIIQNDEGMSIGADNDFKITVDSTGGVNIVNDTDNADVRFKIKDGGITTTVMTIDGDTSRIGIGTTTPTTKLQVVGTVKATEFAGNLIGATLQLNNDTITGTLITQSIKPVTNATYNLGSSTHAYNMVYATATSSVYADVAEIYTTDYKYDPGTVVVFGGNKEVTVSTFAQDTRVAGVVSTHPAYLMNDKAEGVAVALLGKVPCKVVGQISKGDLLTTDGQNSGHARKAIDPKTGTIIGKALENHSSASTGMIFVSVGKL
jgi:hypothetical protein